MASLHEGVFFDQAQAEAYMSVFHPQMADFETAEPYEAGEGNHCHILSSANCSSPI